MDSNNSSIKGVVGAILFSLIAIFCWSIFSFVGELGFWSAPAFGLLIPLGFRIFSKKYPHSVGYIAATTIIITLAIIAAAYIGYVMNIYALFLWQGMAFSEITLISVNDYLRMMVLSDTHFVYDCIYEMGVGLIAALIFEVIYIAVTKKKKV